MNRPWRRRAPNRAACREHVHAVQEVHPDVDRLYYAWWRLQRARDVARIRRSVKHTIRFKSGGWRGTTLVWDSERGTLVFTSLSDMAKATPALDAAFRERCLSVVATARRLHKEGKPYVLRPLPPGVGPTYVLADASREPADFLRLFDASAACGHHLDEMELPDSLRGTVPTPASHVSRKPPPGVRY